MGKYLVLIFIIASLASCIVQAPKYASVEKVLSLTTGISKDSVSKILGIPPYDLKSISDSGIVLIYKYRTTDRKTIPFFMNKTNGVKAKGKWVDLFITYGKDDNVSGIKSCSVCEETKIAQKKFDYAPIISIISALTLPAALIYLGIKL
jgi:hypothetical protein